MARIDDISALFLNMAEVNQKRICIFFMLEKMVVCLTTQSVIPSI
jgi:hypothetical protein